MQYENRVILRGHATEVERKTWGDKSFCELYVQTGERKPRITLWNDPGSWPEDGDEIEINGQLNTKSNKAGYPQERVEAIQFKILARAKRNPEPAGTVIEFQEVDDGLPF